MPDKKEKPGPKVRMGARGWRMVRQWETLMQIAEAEKPLTAEELNNRVCEARGERDLGEWLGRFRITRDDLTTLRKAGFPVVATDEEGKEIELGRYDRMKEKRGRLKNVLWRLREPGERTMISSTRHLSPSTADLIGLSLLQNLLREDFAPYAFPLYRQLAKLLQALVARVGHRLGQREKDRLPFESLIEQVGAVYSGSVLSGGNLILFRQALDRRVCVSGEYEKDGKVKTITVAPQAFYFSEGRYFMLANYEGKTDLYTFRLERFMRVRLEPKKFATLVSREAIEAALSSSVKGFIGEPRTVRLQITPQIAYLFREYQFHPTQQVEEKEEGSLIVTLNCAVGFALHEWILGLGEHVKVLEPQELVEDLRERIRGMAKNYRKRTTRGAESTEDEKQE